MPARATRLKPSFRGKIWGSTHLEPWFPDSREKTGEVWFLGEREFPVLIKFLFTSEPISVQVHPGDAYARRHENSRGKTEMWHILRAEPGAEIAAGFHEPIGRVRLREAAESGEIEKLLAWHPVQAGETYFTPAGTVHAIGAGLALCEIQQNSDVTYRLYDYGRDRPLHLEKGAEVADLGRHPGRVEPRGGPLVESEYFVTSLLEVDGPVTLPGSEERMQFFISLEGSGKIGGDSFRLGEVWYVAPGAGEIALDGRARLLHVKCRDDTGKSDFYCPQCRRPEPRPLVCADCRAVICRECGGTLERVDDLGIG
ncbi:MAG: class I mannose-6-phosphate isomerase [Bryobacteraceae bacterium]